MGYAIYRVGNRWGGYGVPTICEHPDCNKEIDRGISFACGGEPFSEWGCDMYFCGEHLEMVSVTPEGDRIDCEHTVDECDCSFYEVCEPCSNPKIEPFPYKPEHPDWVVHLLNDESWEEWRNESPIEVEKMKELIIE